MKLNPLSLFPFSFLNHNAWNTDVTTLPQEYDYVVIGGGIAYAHVPCFTPDSWFTDHLNG